ncbi:MAG: hypothetical protein U0520_04890 [Candidatus Saccharimonadales bacterium]
MHKNKGVVYSFVAAVLIIPLIASAIVVRAQCKDGWFSRLVGVNNSCGDISRSAQQRGQISFTDANGKRINLDLSELAEFVDAQKDKGFSDFQFNMGGNNMTVSAGGEQKTLNLTEFVNNVLENATTDPAGDQQVLSIKDKKLTIYGGNTIDLAAFLSLADYNSGDGVVVTGGSRIISSVLGTSIATDEVEDEALTVDKLAENSVTSTKIEDGTITFADLNDNECQGGQVIKYSGTNWTCGTGISVGDIKSGMQTADHGGWVKLDGRALTDLTEDQQVAAEALGLVANLPDAANAFLVQNGTIVGSLSSTNQKTLAQNQLPNVTLNGTTSSAGSQTLTYDRGTGSWAHAYDVSGANQQFYGGDQQGTLNIPNHTHSFTTSSINGGVSQQQLDVTPRSLSVTMFIYLGL